MPFTKTTHHEAVKNREEPWENQEAYDTCETRFCIVSTETGEILDDAQGFGYKTAQKAYAGYAYRSRDKSKDKERQEKQKHIESWMKQHRSFMNLLEAYAFEIAKGSMGPEEKFDAKLVKRLLQESGLQPDFTAGELLRALRKR